MASVKNWEAQAKTNSILASSLKSLEARVDDLATLMEWYAAPPFDTTMYLLMPSK
jgi:hypothetical protein